MNAEELWKWLGEKTYPGEKVRIQDAETGTPYDIQSLKLEEAGMDGIEDVAVIVIDLGRPL